MVFAKCFSLVKKFEARLHDIFYSWTFDLLLINSRYSVWSFRSNRSELNRIYSLWSFRSSRPEKQSPEVFCTKGALRNFAKFTEKHLCQSHFFDEVADLRPVTLLKKRLWHRCFIKDITKFLRTPFLQNISSGCFWSLFLIKPKKYCMCRIQTSWETNHLKTNKQKQTFSLASYSDIEKNLFLNVKLKLLRNKC